MQKLTHQQLLSRQKQQTAAKLPFTLLVNNVRSLYNVGSLFRTADGIGVEKIWLCGITGIPPSGRITKTALGAEEQVEWGYERKAVRVLQDLRRKGYQIVLLEQTVESMPYHTFDPTGPVCLVVGNEVDGVCENLLTFCDTALEVEMTGLKNSLNVTVAFGIVGYHIRQRLLKGTL